jgi:hypothetical protein
MNTTAVRKELKRFIDAIPESNLEIVRPMLSFLAGYQANKTLVIETDLTAEEKAVIKAGRKERKEHPENFTPWATIKAEPTTKKRVTK